MWRGRQPEEFTGPQNGEDGRILDFGADSNPAVLEIRLSLTTSRDGFNSFREESRLGIERPGLQVILRSSRDATTDRNR